MEDYPAILKFMNSIDQADEVSDIKKLSGL